MKEMYVCIYKIWVVLAFNFITVYQVRIVHIYVCLQYTYILNVLNLEDFEYYYYYNQI